MKRATGTTFSLQIIVFVLNICLPEYLNVAVCADTDLVQF